MWFFAKFNLVKTSGELGHFLGNTNFGGYGTLR
jgi:hypothetical protein